MKAGCRERLLRDVFTSEFAGVELSIGLEGSKYKVNEP